MSTNSTKHDPRSQLAIRCFAVAGTVALLAAGCDMPGKPNPEDRPKTPDQIVDFDVLFRQNCSGCHGADGNLGPAPPLNDPLFLSIVSQDELARVIREGRHGTPMPAFAQHAGGTLTDAQIGIIAEQIPAHWKSDTKSAEPLPEYLLAKGADADSPPDNLKQGAEVFERACSECHGSNGDGEFSEAGAINDPAFLGLISNQALRRIIITGRPDLGMPNYSESKGRPSDFKALTSDEINDLVALLASWRTRNHVAMNE